MGGAAPFWFFVPMMTLNFCLFGFIGTNFNALAMDPLGHVAGTASSVLGFMQTFGGGLFGAVIGYFYNGTVIPMLCGFISLSLLSLGCVILAEGRLFEAKYDRPAAVSRATRCRKSPGGIDRHRSAQRRRRSAGPEGCRAPRPDCPASQAAIRKPSRSRGV